MVLVDTNILMDVATCDPVWFAWSSSRLARLVNARKAAINPVIYTELMPLYDSSRELDSKLVTPADFRRLPLPFSVAVAASSAFREYRKAGGQRKQAILENWLHRYPGHQHEPRKKFRFQEF